MLAPAYFRYIRKFRYAVTCMLQFYCTCVCAFVRCGLHAADVVVWEFDTSVKLRYLGGTLGMLEKLRLTLLTRRG